MSANGVDFYFASYDHLVTQDHNGQEVKIYDARTNGGFPAEVPAPNCQAAAQGPGPGSTPPPPMADRTSADQGVPARSQAKKKHQKKQAKHQKKRAKHKKQKQKRVAKNRSGRGAQQGSPRAVSCGRWSWRRLSSRHCSPQARARPRAKAYRRSGWKSAPSKGLPPTPRPAGTPPSPSRFP